MEEFFRTYPPKGRVIAAGVSGGADSLALVLRLNEWAEKNNHKVVALTVDHGLRPESAQEADYVSSIMKNFGIEHHILVWEGEKPHTGVEAVARAARYDLLCNWCKENDVSVLATGHHKRDQAETFLLRLQRGSGVYGLSGILPQSSCRGLTLIRPQLNVAPEELKNYLQAKGIRWVEDPSNQWDVFQRVKIRKFLPMLEREIGISVSRLAETTAVLARTRAYFEECVAHLIKSRVRFWEDAALSVSVSVFCEQPTEVSYRLLAELLQRISGNDYPPEADEILRLNVKITEKDFNGATLGDCELIVSRHKLWIVPEVREAQEMSRLQWNECLHFVPQYAKADLPYKVRRAIFNKVMKKDNGQKK